MKPEPINMPNPRSEWKPSEFAVIAAQVAKRPDKFAARLSANLRAEGACLLWVGHKDRNGYCRINFRLGDFGQPKKFMKIGVHRLFLILKLKKPILPFHEAGHIHCCNPLCVVHLEEQTRKANRDAVNKSKAEKQHGEQEDNDFPYSF